MFPSERTTYLRRNMMYLFPIEDILQTQTPWQEGAKESFRDIVLQCPSEALHWFGSLHDLDAAIAKFYYIMGLTQNQIATILEVSQPSIKKRLVSIMKKLKLFAKAPASNPSEVHKDLALFIFDEEMLNIARLQFVEGNMVRVALILGSSQGRVRGMMALAVYAAQGDEIAKKYLDHYKKISRNLGLFAAIWKHHDTTRRAHSLVR